MLGMLQAHIVRSLNTKLSSLSLSLHVFVPTGSWKGGLDEVGAQMHHPRPIAKGFFQLWMPLLCSITRFSPISVQFHFHILRSKLLHDQ